MMDFKVYLMSLNLSRIREDDDVESFVKREGKLISLYDSDRINISQVFCLRRKLLCVTEDTNTRLVIWNPYSGTTRTIKPTSHGYHKCDRYAFGYEPMNSSNRSYKILRVLDDYPTCEFEMYSLKSDSWKVVDVSPDCYVDFHHRGVPIEGNSYWYAKAKLPEVEDHGEVVVGGIPDFLICFDFTTERFGPRLPLPFHPRNGDIVTLSSVGKKQLAVLRQRRSGPYTVKIWISSKIEPNAVSWRQLFLSVDIEKPLTCCQHDVCTGSFFVDDEKEVAVVLGKEKDTVNSTRNIACILGKKGYFKQVDLGECAREDCFPLVLSCVPTSRRFKQAAVEIKVNKTVEEATQELGSGINEADKN